MRSVLIAAAMLSMGGAAEAGQQHLAMHGPAMGSAHAMGGHAGQHWGGRMQGHWVGGMRAPGGWTSYRRPVRGYRLPRYWFSPGFYISDWAGYGLGQPPFGYTWTRYYDDAVLIDGRGMVYDSVSGIPWDQYDLDEAQGGRADAYNANTDSYRAGQGAPYPYPPQGQGPRVAYPPQQGYGPDDAPQQGYAPGAPYPAPGGYREHRSSGVGGAIAGAAVGGVAGGLIAGRHDRVGGALIGAGVGGVAGYALDHRRRGHDGPPPPYAEGPGGPGVPYPMPGPGPRGPYGPLPGAYPGGGTTVTTTTSTSNGGGTWVNGAYYPSGTVISVPGSSVTTVTVASAPVVTTTTEVWEDTVTYSHPIVRRVYRKRIYRPRAKPRCSCAVQGS